MPTYRELSRKDWSRNDGNVYIDDAKIGCLQRIADAAEKMALNHDQLVRRAEWLENHARDLRAQVDRLSRSNAALRGHLRRVKKASTQAKA